MAPLITGTFRAVPRTHRHTATPPRHCPPAQERCYNPRPNDTKESPAEILCQVYSSLCSLLKSQNWGENEDGDSQAGRARGTGCRLRQRGRCLGSLLEMRCSLGYLRRPQRHFCWVNTRHTPRVISAIKGSTSLIS